MLDDLAGPAPELDALARRVVDACIKIHIKLGPGLPESHYGNAMAIEFRRRGIPFVREPIVVVAYEGKEIGECRLDFVIDHRLVLEIKAIEKLGDVHRAQVLTYLKITNCRLGLLINWNVERLLQGVTRVINPYHQP